eukprot:2947750-Amphidinium_carterae.1
MKNKNKKNDKNNNAKKNKKNKNNSGYESVRIRRTRGTRRTLVTKAFAEGVQDGQTWVFRHGGNTKPSALGCPAKYL